MSIWVYDDGIQEKEVVRAAIYTSSCIFCSTPLEELRNTSRVVDRGPITGSAVYEEVVVRCCPTCGWWFIRRSEDDRLGGPLRTSTYGATARLKQLSLSDQSVPVEEIRAYLAARYDARLELDPWKFEQTVASVYRDLGYRARVTSRSGDDGIDVILDGPGDEVVGIQVKRYRNLISVDQIRSFAGALLINGMTRGMFVTTSGFQSGAERTSALAAMRGIAVELVDAGRFYDALGLAQRNAYESLMDRSAPYARADQILVSSITSRFSIS